MNLNKLIKEILSKKEKIENVYFIACGGSLVDLYPGYYFLQAESSSLYPVWVTAKEFVTCPPKRLGKNSLIIALSHGGNTPEVIEAILLGKEYGASIITLTHNKNSKCADENYRNGYRQFEKYDKDGEPVYETLIDDDPELDIECENCGHSVI